MPAINWCFICDYAFVDEKGRASIIKTFSYIRAPILPFRYPQLFLALEFMAQKGESFSLGAVITAPSGKQLAKVDITRKAKEAQSETVEKGFFPIGFYSLQFEEPGEHHIEILVNGNSVHFLPLMIIDGKERTAA
jgi:hypothetical protein